MSGDPTATTVVLDRVFDEGFGEQDIPLRLEVALDESFETRVD